jgi:hypothetical protein
MAFTHGKAATFWVDDSGDVLRNLTTYLNSVNLTRNADLAETSALGSTYKSFVGGLIDGKLPISGLWDPTVDGYLTGILQLSKDFEYFPAGLGTGNIKEAGKAILTSYEISTGLDGAATFSGEFQIDGAVTRTVL